MQGSRVPGWIGHAVTVGPKVGEIGRDREGEGWSKGKRFNVQGEEADEE